MRYREVIFEIMKKKTAGSVLSFRRFALPLPPPETGKRQAESEALPYNSCNKWQKGGFEPMFYEIPFMNKTIINTDEWVEGVLSLMQRLDRIDARR